MGQRPELAVHEPEDLTTGNGSFTVLLPRL